MHSALHVKNTSRQQWTWMSTTASSAKQPLQQLRVRSQIVQSSGPGSTNVKEFRRGDILWAHLGPYQQFKGPFTASMSRNLKDAPMHFKFTAAPTDTLKELCGPHPVLVLKENFALGLLEVVPGTSKIRSTGVKSQRGVLVDPGPANKLTYVTKFIVTQKCAIDYARLLCKKQGVYARFGVLTPDQLLELEKELSP